MNKKGFGIYEIVGSIMLISLTLTIFTSIILLSIRTATGNREALTAGQVLRTFYNFSCSAVDEFDKNVINDETKETALEVLFDLNNPNDSPLWLVSEEKKEFYYSFAYKNFPQLNVYDTDNYNPDDSLYNVNVDIVEFPTTLSQAAIDQLVLSRVFTNTNTDISFWKIMYPDIYGIDSFISFGSSSFDAEKISVGILRTTFTERVEGEEQAGDMLINYKIIVSTRDNAERDVISYDFYPKNNE